ncbi:DUF397 domain-containing protein [Phytohabitans flavus]|uniref:DUF397 domain-containing protein n=1 Tax=Phytohabitans flavus TaxID=1076124 RepID=A0A6F8Y0X9_9ACTN|nr:DUF397 domain-containing protein [Phytohabitans flavus]BCB79754.1 DUF397 domain-containing protein [Phytohabitans flavus]
MFASINAPVIWRKSTRSAGNGQCVEIATMPEGIAMRDSKDPEGPVLQFRPAMWRDFVGSLRAGEFDRSA